MEKYVPICPLELTVRYDFADFQSTVFLGGIIGLKGGSDALMVATVKGVHEKL